MKPREKTKFLTSHTDHSASPMIYQVKGRNYSALGLQHWHKNTNSAGNSTANSKYCGQLVRPVKKMFPVKEDFTVNCQYLKREFVCHVI